MQYKKLPLYKQIYQDIYEKINNGYYRAGELIPTEEQLQITYDVSRVTVRKALDILVNNLLVERTPGYGTIVKKKVLTQKSLDQKGFSEEMASHGKVAATKVLDFCILRANAQIATILGILENDQVYYFKRARYGNDEILQIEETYMSAELFPDISLHYLEDSKFKFVESKGYKIDIAFHQTNPVMPSPEIAELFKISQETPILKISNTTFLTNGKVMDYTEQFLNSPKYQLRYIRKRED